MYTTCSLILTDDEKKTLLDAVKILREISANFPHEELVSIHTGEVADLTRIEDAISLLYGVNDGFTDCAVYEQTNELFHARKLYADFLNERACFYNNLAKDWSPSECNDEYEIEEIDDINLELK